MNIYDFEIKDSSGSLIKMSDFAGKVILIVNTATKCGLTPQFEELEALHKKYAAEGLVIIGFPSNQFLDQEPETNETVASVCLINFGVTFLLTEKIDVNGKHTHPIFAYLKHELSGFFSNSIKWNFTKFLIDRNGKPFRRYAPATKPLSMENDIKQLLNAKTAE